MIWMMPVMAAAEPMMVAAHARMVFVVVLIGRGIV